MKKRGRPKKSSRKQGNFYFLCIIIAVAVIGITYIFYRSTIAVWQHNNNEKRLEVTRLSPEIKKTLPKIRSQEAFRVPILLYHYVEYVQDKGDTIRQSLNIAPHTFEAQIKTLKDDGFTFIYASELANMLEGKKPLPQKPIILTFDDGYRDFYTDVFPIIKRHQVKAVAYVVPGFLDKPNFMYTSQLEEIAKSKIVEIGAHTVHHSYLKGLLYENAKFEIQESKKILENLLNTAIVSFAYPYGAFDKQAIDLAKDAGFTTAVSTLPGIETTQENKLFLFRIRPGYRTGKVLLEYLKQSHFVPY